jgi:hypothetical protein
MNRKGSVFDNAAVGCMDETKLELAGPLSQSWIAGVGKEKFGTGQHYEAVFCTPFSSALPWKKTRIFSFDF